MINLKDFNPKTVEEAVQVILDNIDDDDRHYIHMNGAASLHFSAGMAMRNVWIHPKGSVLTRHFINRFGPLHSDDMSGMILDAVTAGVRKETFNFEEAAAVYHDYWANQGINPIEGWDY